MGDPNRANFGMDPADAQNRQERAVGGGFAQSRVPYRNERESRDNFFDNWSVVAYSLAA